jgi:hypothetical protein
MRAAPEFAAPTEVNVNITVFWSVTLDSLVEKHPCFGGICCLYINNRSLFYSDKAGSKFLRIICAFL